MYKVLLFNIGLVVLSIHIQRVGANDAAFFTALHSCEGFLNKVSTQLFADYLNREILDGATWRELNAQVSAVLTRAETEMDKLTPEAALNVANFLRESLPGGPDHSLTNEIEQATADTMTWYRSGFHLQATEVVRDAAVITLWNGMRYLVLKARLNSTFRRKEPIIARALMRNAIDLFSVIVRMSGVDQRLIYRLPGFEANRTFFEHLVTVSKRIQSQSPHIIGVPHSFKIQSVRGLGPFKVVSESEKFPTEAANSPDVPRFL